MAYMKKNMACRSARHQLYFLVLYRLSSEVSCRSKIRVNYCHSYRLRMSVAHFQCSSAIISLSLGFRIWSVESRV